MHVRHEEDAVTWLWAFPQLAHCPCAQSVRSHCWQPNELIKDSCRACRNKILRWIKSGAGYWSFEAFCGES